MEHTISALHLGLVAAAHKAGMKAKWCVMSAHVQTQTCRQHATPYRLQTASVASPMSRGEWHRTLNRIECHGAKAVRKEFGVGIRALRAENAYLIERTSNH